jgi:hypothetical protein
VIPFCWKSLPLKLLFFVCLICFDPANKDKKCTFFSKTLRFKIFIQKWKKRRIGAHVSWSCCNAESFAAWSITVRCMKLIMYVYNGITFISRTKVINIQGYSKRSILFQKFIIQKLLTLNPCPVYGWKRNPLKFWYRWSEAAHHWGCGCCYLWHAATSVGRAGLLIWHLPHCTWVSHWVLVRCENNFQSSPFSLYIARHHMFSSFCKINFWNCVLLFLITLYFVIILLQDMRAY